MRRGHGFSPVLLALALIAPPVVNLLMEFQRLRHAGAPPGLVDFGFGADPGTEALPARGIYIPGRLIDFRSPSAFRATYFVHFPRGARVAAGAVAVTPGAVVAGRVVKVWDGIALVKSVEDPAFRVACRSRLGEDAILSGAGSGRGLGAVAGTLDSFEEDEILRTAGGPGVTPAGMIIGRVREGRVVPHFTPSSAAWLYLWYDPDLERLDAVFGTAAGG